MSKVKCNTLENVAGDRSVPVETVAYGAAKSWVNFNGTGTVATRDSFNVSSLTDNGTGDYTVSFSSVMPSANYAPLAAAADTVSAGRWCVPYTNLAASTRVTTRDAAGAVFDATIASVGVHSK